MPIPFRRYGKQVTEQQFNRICEKQLRRCERKKAIGKIQTIAGKPVEEKSDEIVR